MRWHLACLLPYAIFLFFFTAEGNEQSWNYHCPASCSCQLIHLKDLPMQRWLSEGLTGHQSTVQETYEFSNEAMYADDTSSPKSKTTDVEYDDIMKMAICIFQKGYDPIEILNSLSSYLEVLTILQSPDSSHITLGSNAFQNLQDLKALEIQGFHKSGSLQTSGHHTNRVMAHIMLANDEPTNGDQIQLENKITILNDALQPLTSLHYLNLQYVKLQGGGKIMHSYSKTMPMTSDTYKYNVEEDDLKLSIHGHEEHIFHKLVFLAPDPEGEVLPYSNYNEKLEKSAIYMFSGMSNLIFLRIYGCELKQVNWEMFDGLTELVYLSLENNDLKFIPELTFYGTPNLRVISLAYNKLLSLQSTSLAGLLELRKLDLSHNNFSHLSELSLPPFPHLKTADFRYNPIETVFSSTFEIMNATEVLYLGDGESDIEIRTKSFLGLSSLLRLVIHNVKVLTLERSILTGMGRLRELEMNGYIEAIEYDAFLEVPKLVKLILQNCQLKTISMDAFYGLYYLLYLDLSHNLLESLPPGLFDQQILLKELYLQNNKFKELPDNIFKQVPAKMIRLEGNPWHCSCSMMTWRETAINKEKQISAPTCKFLYDKGSSCTQPVVKYVYDNRVAPLCETPLKYRQWSIFYVLRKVLRCKKLALKNKELKGNKLYMGAVEYFKNKIQQHKMNNKAISLINNSNYNMTSIYPTSSAMPGNEEINSTEVKGQSKENKTEEGLKSSKDESRITTSIFMDKNENKLSTTTTITDPILSSKITSVVTSEDNSNPSSSANSHSTDEHVENSMTETNNVNSKPTASTPPKQEIPTTNKEKVEAESNKMNISENRELNDIHNYFSQGLNDELKNELPSKRLLTYADNFSKNSNKFAVPLNTKNLQQLIQIPATAEEEYFIFDGKKKIKVSRKAYKLEKERQKKEKQKTI